MPFKRQSVVVSPTPGAAGFSLFSHITPCASCEESLAVALACLSSTKQAVVKAGRFVCVPKVSRHRRGRTAVLVSTCGETLCHISDKIIRVCFFWNPRPTNTSSSVKYNWWCQQLHGLLNFKQQTKPLKANSYVYFHIGVKSNLETEIYSNIYFNSAFWDMFISLKNETEQTWIWQHSPQDISTRLFLMHHDKWCNQT